MNPSSVIRDLSARTPNEDSSMLHEYLLRYRDDPPEYGLGLSNHLPMVLTDLARAGADRATLGEFASRYRDKILAQPARGDAARRYERYPELRQQFRGALESEGTTRVLLRHLPLLLDCIEAAAFHCVIRLSHALRAGQLDEIANALAFWSICHQPLSAPASRGAEEIQTIKAWIEALHQSAAQAPQVRRPGLITERFEDVAQSNAYRSLATSGAHLPLCVTDAVQEIGLAAANIYSVTGNFTVLHVVTGAEALLHVLTFVNPEDADSKRLSIFSSIAAVFLAAEPIQEDAISVPALSWAELETAAMHADDEHVIKLIYSAANWNRMIPNEVWLAAARRAAAPD